MIQMGLLRHGEVTGGDRFRGRSDDPLTAAGWTQMRQATRGECRWDQVISSPRRRCAEFAHEYAQCHGLSVRLEARLAEIYFGAWEGCAPADLMATQGEALKRFWADPLQYTPPDAEPLIDFAARVLDGFRDSILRFSEQRVLVVTHGGVIRVLLCYLRQQPLSKLLEIEVGHGALLNLRLSGRQFVELVH